MGTPATKRVNHSHIEGANSMAFIATIPAGAAQDAVQHMYLRQQAAWGYLPNYAKVFCHRPEQTHWESG